MLIQQIKSIHKLKTVNMKKLLLMIMLLCSITLFSQQQVLDYSNFKTDSSEWVEVKTRIIIDSNNTYDVKIFISDNYWLFERDNVIESGNTNSGYLYKLYTLTNKVSGEIVYLQYFYEIHQSRLLFEDGSYVEFSNPEK